HRRSLVVPRDHHRLDARLPAAADRLLHLLPRRIDHPRQTDKHQIPLRRLFRSRILSGRKLPVGEGQVPQGHRRQLAVHPENFVPQGLAEGHRLPVPKNVAAPLQQHIRRPLGKQHPLAPRPLHQNRLSARIRRTSAGMRSPLSRETISPGTRSAAGIRSHVPPRNTRAIGADNSLRALKDRSARTSCTKPRMAFKKTMAMMATASRYSPRSPEMSVATSRTSTMKSLNWFRNTIKGEVFSPSLSRLGPTVFSRLSASLGSKPTAGSTSKWAATRSASQSTQRLFSDTSTPPLSNFSHKLYSDRP